MAYEHGSLDLGIRNPFRREGALRIGRGAVVAAMGFVVLLQVAAWVKQDALHGWLMAICGFILLGSGLGALGSGIFQMLRFFVGRSVPTSLARNYSKSEAGTAQAELQDVRYSAAQLEQMLMGRKNLTFVEPQGWIARLAHSLLPRLTFLPYPIRNIAQRLISAQVKTLVALVSFILAWFVSVTGLGGETGPLILPVYAALLLIYLIVLWFRAGAPVARAAGRRMESVGAVNLTWVITLSILVPVILALVYQWLQQHLSSPVQRDLAQVWNAVEGFNAGPWLWATVILAVAASGALLVLVLVRASQTRPLTEVSELRENWQESVHPREIFINIESMVMAKRRYLEVPNRVYRDLEPKLEEQTEGKGSFYGELIQETQPAIQAPLLPPRFTLIRLLTTVLGQALWLAAALVLLLFVNQVAAHWHAIAATLHELTALPRGTTDAEIAVRVGAMASAVLGQLHWLAGLGLLAVLARMLANLSHVFWAEMQFESLLVYFKCEGTFTESRLSTGTSVYDSTRSENRVVRSSLTPWVIASRIRSSTFAGIGERNLEFPRDILEMHRADEELQAIVADLRVFLGDREAIASIKNEKDLQAASNIFAVNQSTRAVLGEEPAVAKPALLAEASERNQTSSGEGV